MTSTWTLSDDQRTEMHDLYRHLHAHPELCYEEHRTAKVVADALRGWGIETHTGIAKTGVVATIRGAGADGGRAIGLRADMDALPIVEQTGAAYASKTPGVMHACGHDGHTAMLLGAAKYLAETRNFDGTAVVIFQPAEEGGGGGLAMIEDGLAERWGIQEFYGMHNMPGIPVGTFAIREGGIMAAADQFEITVTGKGGHAARPHTTIDPIVVQAHIVQALQTIAMAPQDSKDPAVQSVRAQLALAAKAPSGAAAELQAKVAADPNDHQARFDLAEAQSAAGDFKGAVDNLLRNTGSNG